MNYLVALCGARCWENANRCSRSKTWQSCIALDFSVYTHKYRDTRILYIVTPMYIYVHKHTSNTGIPLWCACQSDGKAGVMAADNPTISWDPHALSTPEWNKEGSISPSEMGSIWLWKDQISLSPFFFLSHPSSVFDSLFIFLSLHSSLSLVTILPLLFLYLCSLYPILSFLSLSVSHSLLFPCSLSRIISLPPFSRRHRQRFLGRGSTWGKAGVSGWPGTGTKAEGRIRDTRRERLEGRHTTVAQTHLFSTNKASLTLFTMILVQRHRTVLVKTETFAVEGWHWKKKNRHVRKNKK